MDCDIDVHIDEHGDGTSDCLLKLAQKTIEYNYYNRVVAGHCSSLSLSPPRLFADTLTALSLSQITVVSLPMCNMYLQDRSVSGSTPKWRGIPPVQEMQKAGVHVVFASDNVRDAFYPYGDYDMLEVMSQSFRAAHLDGQTAYDWLVSITTSPGRVFRGVRRTDGSEEVDEVATGGERAREVSVPDSLPDTSSPSTCASVAAEDIPRRASATSKHRQQRQSHGELRIGQPANFVIVSARSLTELMCRPGAPRVVIRDGEPIQSELPSYSELDILPHLANKITVNKMPSVPPSDSAETRASQGTDLNTKLHSSLSVPLYSLLSKGVPIISLRSLLTPSSSFSSQTEKNEVIRQLWEASSTVGFFQITDHGITEEEIDCAFRISESFFSQSLETKRQYALQREINCGYEYYEQTRPSAIHADQKESFQMTISQMTSNKMWPSETEVSGFQTTLETFAQKNHQVALTLLRCFTGPLNLPHDCFDRSHDMNQTDNQCTLRLLHYPTAKRRVADKEDSDTRLYRASPHTDWNCLTLLYQREGQRGLEVYRSQACEGEWTGVIPRKGVITVNIGDMLMRWSDDRLRSTFHRVLHPYTDNDIPCSERHSIAYFMQPNKNVIIQGPRCKYDPITAEEYLQKKIKTNYS